MAEMTALQKKWAEERQSDAKTEEEERFDPNTMHHGPSGNFSVSLYANGPTSKT